MLSQVKVPGVLTGFSGGLVIGLLVSALIGAGAPINLLPGNFSIATWRPGEIFSIRLTSMPPGMTSLPPASTMEIEPR